MSQIPYKIYLSENEMPKQWYNVRADMIGTGGTIASGRGKDGLIPELTTQELLSFVPDVRTLCEVDCLQLFSLDSTNLAPVHWLKLAETIRRSYLYYDGFVISHGTDTMVICFCSRSSSRRTAPAAGRFRAR